MKESITQWHYVSTDLPPEDSERRGFPWLLGALCGDGYKDVFEVEWFSRDKKFFYKDEDVTNIITAWAFLPEYPDTDDASGSTSCNDETMMLIDDDEFMDKVADSLVGFFEDHDVVKVVRCKNCFNKEKQLDHLYCDVLQAVVPDDFWCANGENGSCT